MNVIYLFGKTKDETFPQTHKVSTTTGQGSTWICQARSFQSLVPQLTMGKRVFSTDCVLLGPNCRDLWGTQRYIHKISSTRQGHLRLRSSSFIHGMKYDRTSPFYFITKRNIKFLNISWAICSCIKTEDPSHLVFYLQALERRRRETCKQCHRHKYSEKQWP